MSSTSWSNSLANGSANCEVDADPLASRRSTKRRVGSARARSYDRVVPETILTEQRGDVLLITLNRPEKLNAWNTLMGRELKQAIGDANRDAGIGAIVVTGAGRAFCAGADIGDTFVDSDVTTASSGAESAGAGVAYILSPIDLLPEVLLGPIGLIDDLFIVAAVLSRLMQAVHPDVVRQHWSGQGDALEVVEEVTEVGTEPEGESKA